MVNYRSEISLSRTGIHGGIRRGSAAAAIGAVLVLSAGVPASQADGGSGSDEPDMTITGSTRLPAIGGLLQGLLGETVPASPQRTPVPEATTVSPSPTTPVPTPTAPTSPTPAPATSAAATGAAAPAPAATSQGTAGPALPVQQPATGQPGAEAAPPAAAAGAASSAAEQPAAGADGASALPGPTATSRIGVPQAVGGTARSRQEITAQAEPAAEAAKVWLGVGLVGSAGAAGLVFTRIRRI